MFSCLAFFWEKTLEDHGTQLSLNVFNHLQRHLAHLIRSFLSTFKLCVHADFVFLTNG